MIHDTKTTPSFFSSLQHGCAMLSLPGCLPELALVSARELGQAGGVTRPKQSHKVRKKEIATLPMVARALKGDAIILRKCPWGAMTGRDYETISMVRWGGWIGLTVEHCDRMLFLRHL